MAGSLNKVMLIGNLGNDPEVRSTQDGRSLCTFSIATTESWKDKNSGERRDKTEWHRIVIFNEGLVRIAEQYLKKGSKVFLEGQLQTRKWEDKDGIEKYTTEVVLQNFNGNLQEQIKQITADINCQKFIFEKNKIYCWDGKKFNLYKK